MPEPLPTVALRRVVVATDFSEVSRRALAHAVWAAKAADAELVVLHVIDAVTIVGVTHSTATTLDSVRAELAQTANEQMRAWVEDAQAAGVRVRSRIGDGRPEDIVLGIVQEEDADLLVLGTHGMGGFKRLLLGSVAQAIVRHVEVPVLLVR